MNFNPGYYSQDAVNDLLAVKNGEIAYLRETVDQQTKLIEDLQYRLDEIRSALNRPKEKLVLLNAIK